METHPFAARVSCGRTRGAIWKYAASVGAAITTKDEDFAVRRLPQPGPAVVWLRVGNTRRQTLLARLEAELPAILLALEQGESLVEVA